MRGATTKKEELMPTQGWGGKMNWGSGWEEGRNRRREGRWTTDGRHTSCRGTGPCAPPTSRTCGASRLCTWSCPGGAPCSAAGVRERTPPCSGGPSAGRRRGGLDRRTTTKEEKKNISSCCFMLRSRVVLQYKSPPASCRLGNPPSWNWCRPPRRGTWSPPDRTPWGWLAKQSRQRLQFGGEPRCYWRRTWHGSQWREPIGIEEGFITEPPHERCQIRLQVVTKPSQAICEWGIHPEPKTPRIGQPLLSPSSRSMDVYGQDGHERNLPK